jgi:RNA polymerase sigma-70 factor (ECF subfamily)
LSSASLQLSEAESSAATMVRPDFDAIYEEHFDFVWRSARRRGVTDASIDDVVQDVFLVVHRRLGDYDGRASIRAWLFGIVGRVVADHHRSFRRKEARCEPHPVDANGEELSMSARPTPCEEAENDEALRLVVSLLDQLDTDKRELLVLAKIEQMSVPEIAQCFGQNVNTVYTRLRAARLEFDAAYATYRARLPKRAP